MKFPNTNKLSELPDSAELCIKHNGKLWPIDARKVGPSKASTTSALDRTNNKDYCTPQSTHAAITDRIVTDLDEVGSVVFARHLVTNIALDAGDLTSGDNLVLSNAAAEILNYHTLTGTWMMKSAVATIADVYEEEYHQVFTGLWMKVRD